MRNEVREYPVEIKVGHAEPELERRTISATTVCDLGLLLLLVLYVVAWAPLFVRWPRWSDHEHFATLAYAWTLGELPYRDFININLPGEVYVFWLLGKTCGWSADWSIYAFDLCCLGATFCFLIAWSRRVTSSWTAGLATAVIYLSYYTTLSYNLAAQRDGQAAVLALTCVLAPTAWRGRTGAVASGVAFAVAFVIRPHVVAFLPAVAISIATVHWPRWRDLFSHAMAWSVAAIATSLPLWAPIHLAGLWPHLLDAMRLNLLGEFRDLGGMGRPSMVTLLREILWTKHHLGVAMLAAVCGVAGRWSEWRRTWLSVVTALGGGLFYILLHPARHSYLEQPFLAFWAVALGLFLAEVCRAPIPARWTIPIVLVMAVAFQHSHSHFTGSLSLALGGAPAGAEGRHEIWRRQSAKASADLTWEEFDELRKWLLTDTNPETRIANFCWGVNFATNVGRLPALPVEGPWLWYHAASEPRFRSSLQKHADTVLLWNPEKFDQQYGSFPELVELIRTEYEPATQIGAVEVRRRKGH